MRLGVRGASNRSETITSRHSSFNQVREIGEAEKYNQHRFKSRKMRKLDHVEKAFAQDLVARIGSGGVLADVPCGAGRFTPIFAELKHVHGFDICDSMIEVARKSNPQENVDYEVGNATNLPLDDASVDAVFSMRLFHHIEKSADRRAIFRELSRVSKRWVAVSFYRTSVHHWKRVLLGKEIHGFPIALKQFLSEAAASDLYSSKVIRNVLVKTNQTLVLFEKKI